MELIFRNGRCIGQARYTMKERIAMYLHPRNKIQPAHHSGKYYIATSTGVLIIPEDFSYTHFINNTWYERDDFNFSDAVQSGIQQTD